MRLKVQMLASFELLLQYLERPPVRAASYRLVSVAFEALESQRVQSGEARIVAIAYKL